MKKILILATVFSFSSFAATTGTLVLKGTVPAVLEIDVTGNAAATTLPLDTVVTGSNEITVASVNEKSNSSTGYDVSISSDNGGFLVHETVGSSKVAYGITYDGAAVNLASGETFQNPSSSYADVDKDVVVNSLAGSANYAGLLEGEYQDTLTFTISAH